MTDKEREKYEETLKKIVSGLEQPTEAELKKAAEYFESNGRKAKWILKDNQVGKNFNPFKNFKIFNPSITVFCPAAKAVDINVAIFSFLGALYSQNAIGFSFQGCACDITTAFAEKQVVAGLNKTNISSQQEVVETEEREGIEDAKAGVKTWYCGLANNL